MHVQYAHTHTHTHTHTHMNLHENTHTHTLTHCAECHEAVLPGVDALVVWPVAPHVCSTVNQPGSIEHQGVAHEAGHEVAHCQGLAPQVPGY